MALLFYDNFGGYTLAQAGAAWGGGVVGVNQTISASGGRNGGPYYQNSASSSVQSINTQAFTPSATWVVGMACYPVTGFANATDLMSILDSGTVQLSLLMNADGTLSVVRSASTAVTGGTSILSLSADVWHFIEMKVTIADSIGANTCQVWVNDVLWLTVATGQDLKATANATANQVRFGKTNFGTATFRLTDIYVDNGTTLYGDSTITVLTATGNGTTQDFTSSSGGHYTDVDDATHDTDATYVESAVNGDIELFQMSNMPVTPVAIHAVAPWNLVRKTDGGLKTARSLIRSGSTNYGQTDFNATDSYKYNQPITIVDPDTAAAWTESGVNAIEVGVEVRS